MNRLVILLTFAFILSANCAAFSQKKDAVSAMVVLPDQDSILAASDKGLQLIRLSQPDSGKRFKTEVEKISAIKLSPDKKWIAVLGGTPSEEGTIEIRKVSDLKTVVRQAVLSDIVTDGAWIDDQSLWVAGMTGKLIQFNFKKKEIKKISSGHSRGILAIELMRDQTLLTGSIDQSIRVHKKKKARVLNNHTGTANDLAIQPSEDKNALEMVASCSNDGTVRFWQPAIGRMVRFVRLESIPICLTWTADGSSVIAGCRDGKLRWIDPGEVKVIKTVKVTNDWIFCVELDSKKGSGWVGTASGVKSFKSSKREQR